MSHPLSIYIIDDDQICQFIFQKLIQNIKPESAVLLFSDGEQALEFLLGHTAQIEKMPDLLLVDINMPVMDGWQFTVEYAKIKSHVGKRTTLFIVSSSVDPIDRNRAKQIPDISGYVEKPLDLEKMARILEAVENDKPG